MIYISQPYIQTLDVFKIFENNFVIKLCYPKKETTVNNACLLVILATNFPFIAQKTSHYIHTLPLYVIEKLIIYHKVLKFRLVRIFFILNYDIHLMIFLFLLHVVQ